MKKYLCTQNAFFSCVLAAVFFNPHHSSSYSLAPIYIIYFDRGDLGQ